MSSLSLAVSIPATTVLEFVIFVDPCLVKRTRLFGQPSGSDEGADDDQATGQPQTAQGANDPIASRSAADAVRGRAFLSEHTDGIRIPCYKGAIARRAIASGNGQRRAYCAASGTARRNTPISASKTRVDA